MMTSQIPDGVVLYRKDRDSAREGLLVVKNQLKHLQALIDEIDNRLR